MNDTTANFIDTLKRNGYVIVARGNGADPRRTRDAEMCEERPPYLHALVVVVGANGWAGGIRR